MFTKALIIIFGLYCILLSFISIKLYRKISNSVNLFLCSVLISSIVAILGGVNDDEKMSNALIWLFIGTAFFLSAFLISQTVKSSVYRKKNEMVYNLSFLNKLINLCCFFVLLNFFVGLYDVTRVAGSLSTVIFHSSSVRQLYLNRSGLLVVDVLGNFCNINSLVLLCLFPVAIRNKCKHVYIKLMFVFIVRMASSLITMSKEAFLIFLVIFVVAFMQELPPIKEEILFLKKNLKWIFLMVIALLLVISIQRNYLAGRYNNYVQAILGTLQEYVGISVSSFALLIDQDNPVFQLGRQCFRPIFNILAKFGMGTSISIVQKQVNGSSGNVYTIFGNMFNDFGFWGIILLSILFGLLLGAIYNSKDNNRLDTKVINAIINMTFVFAFYDFKLIQTVYIFTMIYAILINWILYSKLYKKRIIELNE